MRTATGGSVHDVAGDLLRPLHQLGVRHDLVDQADAQRFRASTGSSVSSIFIASM